MILSDCSTQNNTIDSNAEAATGAYTPYADASLICSGRDRSDLAVIPCPLSSEGVAKLNDTVDIEQNLATIVVDVNDADNPNEVVAEATIVPTVPESCCEIVRPNLSLYANPRATRRAEFISATVIKASTSNNLGLEIERSTYTPKHLQCPHSFPCFRITRLDEDSLLSASPFQPGDRLVSINGKPCFLFGSADEISRFLAEELIGTVTIVCEDEQGQANYVESMVEKPAPDALLGVVFMRKHGKLVLKEISEDSVCSSSLLNAGDRLVAINSFDCQNEHAHAVAEWVHDSPRYVTFLTETQRSKAVVVAAASFLYGPSISGSAVGSSSRRSHQERGSAAYPCFGIHPMFCCVLVMVVIIVTFSMISIA